jgi:hypothetical protein
VTSRFEASGDGHTPAVTEQETPVFVYAMERAQGLRLDAVRVIAAAQAVCKASRAVIEATHSRRSRMRISSRVP